MRQCWCPHATGGVPGMGIRVLVLPEWSAWAWVGVNHWDELAALAFYEVDGGAMIVHVCSIKKKNFRPAFWALASSLYFLDYSRLARHIAILFSSLWRNEITASRVIGSDMRVRKIHVKSILRSRLLRKIPLNSYPTPLVASNVRVKGINYKCGWYGDLVTLATDSRCGSGKTRVCGDADMIMCQTSVSTILALGNIRENGHNFAVANHKAQFGCKRHPKFSGDEPSLFHILLLHTVMSSDIINGTTLPGTSSTSFRYIRHIMGNAMSETEQPVLNEHEPRNIVSSNLAWSRSLWHAPSTYYKRAPQQNFQPQSSSILWYIVRHRMKGRMRLRNNAGDLITLTSIHVVEGTDYAEVKIIKFGCWNRRKGG
ncbi:hypothetical protein BD779DRAFT_1478952 [Infundibulicybe gibba]|nr:hypothetical protein BD779DRAFT_1478952 [Infundibulicybe gibba]